MRNKRVALGALLIGLTLLAVAYLLRTRSPAVAPPTHQARTIAPIPDPLPTAGTPPGTAVPEGTRRPPLPSLDPTIETTDVPRETLELGRFVEAGSTFRERAGMVELEIRNKLVRLPSSERLGFLTGILLTPSAELGSTCGEDRLRRIFAAKFLPLVARDDPSTVPAILSAAKAQLKWEQDPQVRSQIIASLGGVPLRAGVVSRSINGGPAEIVEQFSKDRSESSDGVWLGSLKQAVCRDAEAIATLAEISSSRSNPSRVLALDVLANADTELATHAILAIYKADPSSRSFCAAALSKSKDLRVLGALIDTLSTERDVRVISPVARAIETSPSPPEGAAAALRGAYGFLPRKEGDILGEQALRSVVASCAALAQRTQDKAAVGVLADALRGPATSLSAALRAVEQYPHACLSHALREALAPMPMGYLRERAVYALRLCDPSHQEPSLMWDIAQIKTTLSKKDLPDPQRRDLTQTLEGKERALKLMRAGE